jgi:hypothetical protein
MCTPNISVIEHQTDPRLFCPRSPPTAMERKIPLKRKYIAYIAIIRYTFDLFWRDVQRAMFRMRLKYIEVKSTPSLQPIFGPIWFVTRLPVLNCTLEKACLGLSASRPRDQVSKMSLRSPWDIGHMSSNSYDLIWWRYGDICLPQHFHELQEQFEELVREFVRLRKTL